VKVQIDGLRETLKAFNDLPKDASKELRDASLELARMLADRARADALVSGGPQGKLLAPTVKAKRDRVPVVEAGGTSRVGRNRAPAYGVLFGSVFGMNGRSGWYGEARYRGGIGRQYRPHQGRDAYWFFPVIEQSATEISEAWTKAADAVVRKFSEGA
jgi:hypothetical protein